MSHDPRFPPTLRGASRLSGYCGTHTRKPPGTPGRFTVQVHLMLLAVQHVPGGLDVHLLEVPLALMVGAAPVTCFLTGCPLYRGVVERLDGGLAGAAGAFHSVSQAIAHPGAGAVAGRDGGPPAAGGSRDGQPGRSVGSGLPRTEAFSRCTQPQRSPMKAGCWPSVRTQWGQRRASSSALGGR